MTDDLMNYKIVMDYAYEKMIQEENKSGGGNMVNKEYRETVSRHTIAKENFIVAINKFCAKIL